MKLMVILSKSWAKYRAGFVSQGICNTQPDSIWICCGSFLQLRADKEQHAVFAVFDENKSWYLQDNINQFADPTKVNHADPNFYKSNVMHSKFFESHKPQLPSGYCPMIQFYLCTLTAINGYTFESGPALGFCNGEVATWHVSSIGAQDYIQTATFYGHPFELNERTEDFLSLYPMTGETISMNMDNIGEIWSEHTVR